MHGVGLSRIHQIATTIDKLHALRASHPHTRAALVRGDDEWLQMHRHRIERRAVRAVGGEGAPRIAQEAAGVGDGMGGHGELWCL